jgi:drug/metabolite transporter (DMT)-like permease
MSWATIAILSAAIYGIITTVDSHLISKRMPSFRAFLLPLSIIHLFYGSLFLYLFPFPVGTGLWPMAAAVGSCISRIAGATIMVYLFKKEEISRVVPVVYTYPIFVALMAMPFLGESITPLQWLAIVTVVAGAVIVSFKQNPFGSAMWPGKLFLVLVGSSLLLATADLISKYALAHVSFWNMFTVNAFCIFGIFFGFSLRPHVIRQLRDMKQRNRSLGLMAVNESLMPAALTGSFWALSLGPVSLVSTIISSRPIFVMIYALILNRFSPHFLVISTTSRAMLAFRLIATAMIVGGISIIYLS